MRQEMELFECALDLVRGDTDIGAGFNWPTESESGSRRFDSAWAEYLDRLDTLPSLAAPGFAAQMAAPPHPAALLGYFAAMLRNPNNHDSRFAAATLAMEREVVSQLAAMFGFTASSGGHLTGGGTLANLDGLWSSRQRHPRGAIAFSEDAHFAHERICRLMGLETRRIACDTNGRMDLNRLEDGLRRNAIGTVVLSAGTPGLGAVDPIDAVVALRRRYDFGIHVDASYGGFFALLCHDAESSLSAETARAFAAIAQCDSVAVDPHKHAYQPYGCGCILFRNGGEVTFAQRSPYTQSAARSGLECSRPGAAAGALWLTLRCLPLSRSEGFGPLLRDCREGARRLAAQLGSSDFFNLHVAPELGIVTFLPRSDGGAGISAASRRLVAEAEAEGVFLSLLRLPAARLRLMHPGIAVKDAEAEILRAVLMRPAQRDFVPTMSAILERLAAQADAIRPGSPTPRPAPFGPVLPPGVLPALPVAGRGQRY
jgi:glutamate/tyrosine decarboxylase-like PLP-dependent enzyme